MDGPFDGWCFASSGGTLNAYVVRGVLVIGLEVALIVLTLAMFAAFDLFVRACDRL